MIDNLHNVSYNRNYKGGNKMNQKELGMKIKLARVEKGLTQEQLAEKSSMSRWFVNQLEQGLANPKLGNINAILEALSLSLRTEKVAKNE